MRDKYEISLWEDYFDNGQHKERKIAIIGSDSMTSPCRAYNPKLVQNINGTNTFTFEMYLTYKENFVINGVDKILINPFLNLLSNERKVKVLWKNDWYDFIIKNCQEDSSSKKNTYTCQDLFINELSKNGFELEFDSELENNYGTAQELTEKVLEGTDWKVDKENSQILQQKKEEPVYEYMLTEDLSATNQNTNSTAIIHEGQTILLFYEQIQDCIINSKPLTGDFQFAYVEGSKYKRDTNSQLVINADCYIGHFDEIVIGGISSKYRAERLIRNKISKFDPLTDKYCYILKPNEASDGKYDIDDEIYEYTSTKYSDALLVQNLFVNSSNFTSADGWKCFAYESQSSGQATQVEDDIKLGIYKEKGKPEAAYEKTYLRLYPNYKTGDSGYRKEYQNSGLINNTFAIPKDGISIGEEYIIRYKCRKLDSTDANASPEDYRDPIGASYTTAPDLSFKVIDKDNQIYFSAQKTDFNEGKNNYFEVTLQCKKAISKNDIVSKKLLLIITNDNVIVDDNGASHHYSRWLEDIQFFKKIENDEGKIIYPNEIDTSSVVQVVYNYYNHTKYGSLTSADDITPLKITTEPWNDSGNLSYLEDEHFTKRRSISIKQSNRFNILQSIAEQFECWLDFKIEHDNSTGEILYNDDGTPKKYVRIRKEVGQDSGIGFVYGIDLKTIQRTIQSDQIVSKTIVSPNNNEFAKNGSCAISQSNENYPGVDFILNFDYYISQGLIDAAELNNDLYSSTGNGLKYYPSLHNKTTTYKNNTEIIQQKRNQILHYESQLKVFEKTLDANNDNINRLKNELTALAMTQDYDSEETQKYIEDNKDDPGIRARIITINSLTNQQEIYKKNYDNINLRLNGNLDDEEVPEEERIKGLRKEIEEYEIQQKQIIKDIKKLNENFYKKYSRYIQEGTWTSEDYIDENLYYLDALSVAYTSSRPQISYNISVVRISSIEGFENKIFKIGDISFIQDTEFFGYTEIDGIKTPIKEKVVVSVVTSYFDEPSKDSFTVQNYKTQFEDLFQRITSTTQSLQYASGAYAKAASIIDENGLINGETLQASISANETILYGANNESVVWDNTGITVSDNSNILNKVRLTSGGLFISTDGGRSWKNAIRGQGIATQYLTAGNINVGNIVITDGLHTAFRWDAKGINAYSPSYNVSGELNGYNIGKFIRFDHYGIYGVDGTQEFSPASEQDIYNKASFGMTWNRFFMKNNSDSGSVEVSTDEDFQVMAAGKERIKIGRLGSSQVEFVDSDGVTKTKTVYSYGLRISNMEGTPALVAQDGYLWLQDQMSIGNGENTIVSLGYLDAFKTIIETESAEDGTESEISKIYHQVFNANNNFIVYENGDVTANNGIFNGEINAISGSFGDKKQIKIGKNGLTITGSGLLIQDTSELPLLEFIDNTLSISGRIEAQGGTIGGFTIEKNQENDRLISQNSEIILDGKKGVIEAKNILLGEGAKIASFIQLGEKVKLFGVDNIEKPRILETYNTNIGSDVTSTAVTTLYQDGSLKLGNNISFVPSENKGYFGKPDKENTITINGETSIIAGNGWSITPTMATFSNIDLGTGTIHAARFEINQTQLVGGSMIFKQAYSGIFSIDETGETPVGKFIFTDKQKEELKNSNTLISEGDTSAPISFKNHWIIFTSHNRLLSNGDCYKVSDYNDNGGVLFFNPCPSLNEIPDGIIDLGEIDAKNTSWTIAINSETGSLGSFGGGRGLTITEFLNDGNDLITNTPRLFMGDLSGLNSIGIQGYTGVGLYCDNVYLKGEIATEGKKAGISTKNSVVLWAGAEDAESITTAKFRGLDDGSVYAEKGFFTNTIIEGSDIYAAHIYGGTRTKSAALNIHSTALGVIFLKGTEKTDTEISFGIKEDGIYTQEPTNYIIQLAEEDKKVLLYGDSIYTSFSSGITNRLHLIDNHIYGCGENESHTTFMQFDGTAAKIGIKNAENKTENIRFQVAADSTTVYETFVLEGYGSEGKVTFSYKTHKVNEKVDGYDLYIS